MMCVTTLVHAMMGVVSSIMGIALRYVSGWTATCGLGGTAEK